MTQAGDLGQIANQARTLYRGRVNVSFQAVSSFNEGSTAPTATYPHMIWADSSSSLIKQRNTSNTAWNIIGRFADRWTWTNIDSSPNEFSTGDLKITLKTEPDLGWIMVRDGTIGDGLSGASERAHADTGALYYLIWTRIAEAWAPVFSASGVQVQRGTSPEADFAAHKRLRMSRALGRTLGIAGGGIELSYRMLGEYLGEERHTLTAAEMFHIHGIPQHNRALGPAGGVNTPDGNTDGPQDSAVPHNIMQPTWFVNLMCRL